MKVVVCVKQVPDSTNVRINPKTNTLMREGVESIVNPFDEFALEQALRLKDSCGAEVTVVSMGPPQATAVLREALARGADRAFLVSSRAFGGADTLATSYTLAQAIRRACDGATPDLVLFGKQAIDGDTAQVGPGVSEFLGLPLVTYVKELQVMDGRANGRDARSTSDARSTQVKGLQVMDGGANGRDARSTSDARSTCDACFTNDVSCGTGVSPVRAYRVTTLMDDGEHVIEGELPAVMTVTKDAAEPRFAPLAGAMSAAKAEIVVLDEKAIAADPIRIGLKGSPTKVVTIFPPPVKGGGRKIAWNGDAATLAQEIREAIHG